MKIHIIMPACIAMMGLIACQFPVNIHKGNDRAEQLVGRYYMLKITEEGKRATAWQPWVNEVNAAINEPYYVFNAPMDAKHKNMLLGLVIPIKQTLDSIIISPSVKQPSQTGIKQPSVEKSQEQKGIKSQSPRSSGKKTVKPTTKKPIVPTLQAWDDPDAWG